MMHDGSPRAVSTDGGHPWSLRVTSTNFLHRRSIDRLRNPMLIRSLFVGFELASSLQVQLCYLDQVRDGQASELYCWIHFMSLYHLLAVSL